MSESNFFIKLGIYLLLSVNLYALHYPLVAMSIVIIGLLHVCCFISYDFGYQNAESDIKFKDNRDFFNKEFKNSKKRHKKKMQKILNDKNISPVSKVYTSPVFSRVDSRIPLSIDTPVNTLPIFPYEYTDDLIDSEKTFVNVDGNKISTSLLPNDLKLCLHKSGRRDIKENLERNVLHASVHSILDKKDYKIPTKTAAFIDETLENKNFEETLIMKNLQKEEMPNKNKSDKFSF